LNTPQAIAHLHEIAAAIFRNDVDRYPLQRELSIGAGLLGLLGSHPLTWLHRGQPGDSWRIDERVAARAQARRERRFADADQIRDELEADGIILEDHPDRPTTWRSR